VPTPPVSSATDLGEMSRSHNYRLVKLHRNYTVEEIAQLFCVHKNTVRTWVKQGLHTIDDGRPILVLGTALSLFLQNRRQRARRPSGPGEMYCVRCRAVKCPSGNFAEYHAINAKSGNLRAICPDCASLMHRRSSMATLDRVRGDLEISFWEGSTRIGGSQPASLGCDSSLDGGTDENAPPAE
jgi:hypothetical protein